MSYETIVPSEDDLTDIESIIERSFEEENSYEASQALRYAIYGKFPFVYSAIDTNNKETIGFIQACANEEPMIEWLAVDPDYRREGIGLSLVKTVARELCSIGHNMVYLIPTKHSEKFYHNIGFEYSSANYMSVDLEKLIGK